MRVSPLALLSANEGAVVRGEVSGIPRCSQTAGFERKLVQNSAVSSLTGRRVGCSSEQLHINPLPGLDHVGVRGNFDVAVGVRHAGDVSG